MIRPQSCAMVTRLTATPPVVVSTSTSAMAAIKVPPRIARATPHPAAFGPCAGSVADGWSFHPAFLAAARRTSARPMPLVSGDATTILPDGDRVATYREKKGEGDWKPSRAAVQSRLF